MTLHAFLARLRRPVMMAGYYSGKSLLHDYA